MEGVLREAVMHYVQDMVVLSKWFVSCVVRGLLFQRRVSLPRPTFWNCSRSDQLPEQVPVGQSQTSSIKSLGSALTHISQRCR
jgi:hypothetical protein